MFSLQDSEQFEITVSYIAVWYTMYMTVLYDLVYIQLYFLFQSWSPIENTAVSLNKEFSFLKGQLEKYEWK